MKDAKSRAQEALKKGCLVQAGQVYRHYKGGLYVVVAVALEEATLQPVVVYRSCTHGTVWTRTVEDFCCPLVEEASAPRFAPVT